MNAKFISKEDFKVNEWSGGTTNQLYIYPDNATLQNRDFIYRISSASFTTTSSKFSDFSNYNRYILTLKGDLYIEHKDLYNKHLENYEIEYFLGNWNTYSQNSLDCIDYNIIVKEGVQSRVEILKEKDIFIPKKNGTLLIYSEDECDINIYEKQESILSIPKSTLTIIQEEERLHKLVISSSKMPVILCEIIL